MKNPRKKAIAILAGLAVTGIVGASAASLGTITNQSLGAATEVVASCDADGVTVGYTAAYDAASNSVLVSDVTISAVAAACEGLGWEVVLTADPAVAGDPRVVLGGPKTGTVPAPGVPLTDTSFTASYAPGVDAEAVTGIAITISG